MRIDFNSAACLKEVLQQCSTFFHKHASDNFGMVVELLLGEEIDHAAASASLGIGRAEHDACNARMHHRARAHGTRFKRDVQTRSDKAVVTDTLRRSPHRLDLGVGSRIMTRNRRIVSLADNLAIEYDDRADRNLSQCPTTVRNTERFSHQLFIARHAQARFEMRHAIIYRHSHLNHNGICKQLFCHNTGSVHFASIIRKCGKYTKYKHASHPAATTGPGQEMHRRTPGCPAQPYTGYNRYAMSTIDRQPLIDFARLPATFYADPYPVYARLRSEEPVYRCPDGSVLLTRYADCYQVYRNPTLYISDKRRQFKPQFGDSPLFEHHTTSLVFNDPPLHTQVRRAIGNALSSRTIAPMEAPLVELVDRLLDSAQDKEHFDGITDFAGAIPVEVIGNLLQIPVPERAPLRLWSLAILGALEVGLTAEQFAEGNTAVTEFLDYLESFVEHRRKRLKRSNDDMLARLLRWQSL